MLLSIETRGSIHCGRYWKVGVSGERVRGANVPRYMVEPLAMRSETKRLDLKAIQNLDFDRGSEYALFSVSGKLLGNVNLVKMHRFHECWCIFMHKYSDTNVKCLH